MMLLKSIDIIAERYPDRLAVVVGVRGLSYTELAERSSALARMLVNSGIGRGSLVAVYMPRTVDTIVAMIAAMKCGAAYSVVEDDGNEAEQLNRLVTFDPDLVVSLERHQAGLESAGLESVDVAAGTVWSGRERLPELSADDTAYVLFTSGSTGTPKGVAVSHGNIAHYTASVKETLGIDEPLRYGHVSTLAADLGNTSLFLSLWTGGCLHLIDSGTRKDPAALRQYLLEHAIEFVKITPSHWTAMFSDAGGRQAAAIPTLRYLVFGGEALPVGLAKAVLESGRVGFLFNHYGPTETTVGVTVFPVRSVCQLEMLGGKTVPIGMPLGQTSLCVRTEDGSFRTRDAEGELYIGGPSVAKGYIGRPDATADRFVAIDPQVGAAGRYYRTGDSVRIDGAGVVQFLGRIDRQVKIHGYRVELEHIESILRNVPEVGDASVLYLELNGRWRLVAAISGWQGRDGFDGLHDYLAGLLPDYMIPRVLLPVDPLPRNANGKTDLRRLKEEVLARLDTAPVDAQVSTAEGVVPDEALCDELRGLCRQYLRTVSFGNTDDFFQFGGDSLDAIQLIGDLQSRGYPISANDFLQNPTVAGLATAILGQRASERAPLESMDPIEVRSFSSAQDFFFCQRLADPDHYNQAVLFQCDEPIDLDALRDVVDLLLASHPLLRTAFTAEADGYVATQVERHGADVLGLTAIGATDESGVQAQVYAAAEHVQKSICLATGNVFRVEVLKFDAAPDHLLLVAHHLAVDVISWRIIVSEMSRLYGDRRAGKAIALARSRTSFWDWVRHLDERREPIAAVASDWLQRVRASERKLGHSVTPANTEREGKTVWLAFSREQTQALQRELPSTCEAPLHAGVIAAFVHCFSRYSAAPDLIVDIESHGRATFDDNVDVSRVVGWHTSTYPVAFSTAGERLADFVHSAASQLQSVPDLGVAYGLLKKSADGDDRSRASGTICYNYLGDVDFSRDDRLKLSRGKYSLPPARGTRNSRGHAYKLSARIVDGQLILDLSFPGESVEQMVVEVMRRLRRSLLDLAGVEIPRTSSVLVERGSRTGLINNVPPGLVAVPAAMLRRRYHAVLLTGATGYVGAHVLAELLQRSDAHVYCLVRNRSAQPAVRRLRESLQWYFPAFDPDAVAGRVTVVEGDVSAERFGLSHSEYERLASVVDAVYHFAADTRLFGFESDFRKNNVDSVRRCIDFAQNRRPKHVHYMSTLAVCGVNPAEAPVVFSEGVTDVGQQFQNYYEETKFAAERLVKQFELAGGGGFIYRSGNVSGHSESARFQRNAHDNRFVQFLAACAKVGRLPQALGEPIALSPVDLVAAGIVAISLDSNLSGGVYHVDSPHSVTMERVFAACRKAGIAFEGSDHCDFATLFQEIDDADDPDIALGRFWAQRRPRNVVFNHDYTLRVLDRHGLRFEPLDDAWIERYVCGLRDAGVFMSSTRPRERRVERGGIAMGVWRNIHDGAQTRGARTRDAQSWRRPVQVGCITAPIATYSQEKEIL